MILWTLGGVLVGAGLFAALIFSLFQAALQRGKLRWAHLAAAALTLAGVASISMLSPWLALLSGAALALASLAALLLDKGWNRLLSLFQMAFAVILILGLPFAV